MVEPTGTRQLLIFPVISILQRIGITGNASDQFHARPSIPFPAEPFGFMGVPASFACASATLPIAAQSTGRTDRRKQWFDLFDGLPFPKQFRDGSREGLSTLMTASTSSNVIREHASPFALLHHCLSPPPGSFILMGSMDAC